MREKYHGAARRRRKKEMKKNHVLWRWLFLISLILGFSAGGFAQSLAELAKKEKERRAKAQSGGESRVITERDLRAQGGLPESLPSVPSPTGEAQTKGEGAEGEEGEEEQDETKTREYWQTRVGDVKKKILELETDLASPDVSWGEGLRTDVNPLGQRNLERRQQLEGELAKARAELQAIQQEARRAGIPAGWVR